MIASCCSTSSPAIRFAVPSPPLWGSVKSPVMGLPAFPVPGVGFVMELLLLSLSVSGSLSSRMVLCAPLIQLSVQRVRTARPNVIQSKIYPDSHILRVEGCVLQRWLKRRISLLARCSSDCRSIYLNLAFVLPVYVTFVTYTCRCHMIYSN